MERLPNPIQKQYHVKADIFLFHLIMKLSRWWQETQKIRMNDGKEIGDQYK